MQYFLGYVGNLKKIYLQLEYKFLLQHKKKQHLSLADLPWTLITKVLIKVDISICMIIFHIILQLSDLITFNIFNGTDAEAQ